jgi:hypothetical protein
MPFQNPLPPAMSSKPADYTAVRRDIVAALTTSHKALKGDMVGAL